MYLPFTLEHWVHLVQSDTPDPSNHQLYHKKLLIKINILKADSSVRLLLSNTTKYNILGLNKVFYINNPLNKEQQVPPMID